MSGKKTPWELKQEEEKKRKEAEAAKARLARDAGVKKGGLGKQAAVLAATLSGGPKPLPKDSKVSTTSAVAATKPKEAVIAVPASTKKTIAQSAGQVISAKDIIRRHKMGVPFPDTVLEAAGLKYSPDRKNLLDLKTGKEVKSDAATVAPVDGGVQEQQSVVAPRTGGLNLGDLGKVKLNKAQVQTTSSVAAPKPVVTPNAGLDVTSHPLFGKAMRGGDVVDTKKQAEAVKPPRPIGLSPSEKLKAAAKAEADLVKAKEAKLGGDKQATVVAPAPQTQTGFKPPPPPPLREQKMVAASSATPAAKLQALTTKTPNPTTVQGLTVKIKSIESAHEITLTAKPGTSTEWIKIAAEAVKKMFGPNSIGELSLNANGSYTFKCKKDGIDEQQIATWINAGVQSVPRIQSATVSTPQSTLPKQTPPVMLSQSGKQAELTGHKLTQSTKAKTRTSTVELDFPIPAKANLDKLKILMEDIIERKESGFEFKVEYKGGTPASFTLEIKGSTDTLNRAKEDEIIKSVKAAILEAQKPGPAARKVF